MTSCLQRSTTGVTLEGAISSHLAQQSSRSHMATRLTRSEYRSLRIVTIQTLCGSSYGNASRAIGAADPPLSNSLTSYKANWQLPRLSREARQSYTFIRMYRSTRVLKVTSNKIHQITYRRNQNRISLLPIPILPPLPPTLISRIKRPIVFQLLQRIISHLELKLPHHQRKYNQIPH